MAASTLQNAEVKQIKIVKSLVLLLKCNLQGPQSDHLLCLLYHDAKKVKRVGRGREERRDGLDMDEETQM